MANGIYTAMTAARAQNQRLESLANNLANAMTPGFKVQRSVYRQIYNEVRAGDVRQNMAHEPVRILPRDRLPTQLDERYTSWEHGALRDTGNPLDLAIDGDGFFVVQAPDGEQLYTRNGSLTIGREGALVNSDGLPVIDEQGRAVRVINETAEIYVSAEGVVEADGEAVATLAIMEVQDPRALERVGDCNYRLPQGAPLATPVVDPSVRQGYLEGSNVNPVWTMTRLIKANRIFELNMRALQTYKEMDDSAAREVGRSA